MVAIRLACCRGWLALCGLKPEHMIWSDTFLAAGSPPIFGIFGSESACGTRRLVARSLVIDASPERVWSLLSSPEAWSLRPAMFAFDVTAPPGSRLRIMLGLGKAGPICVLYEIAEEAPGQAISLHTHATQPPAREHLLLSAPPQGHGTRAPITASSLGARGSSKGDLKAYWQGRL